MHCNAWKPEWSIDHSGPHMVEIMHGLDAVHVQSQISDQSRTSHRSCDSISGLAVAQNLTTLH